MLAQLSLRNRVTILVSLAVAIALVVGIYWFFTEGPGYSIISPRGSTVATFQGEGDGQTATFRVREGWRIRWESTGSHFAMTIGGDRNFGTVVIVDRPDSGLSAPPTEGRFHIEVRAGGPWTITILQGR